MYVSTVTGVYAYDVTDPAKPTEVVLAMAADAMAAEMMVRPTTSVANLFMRRSSLSSGSCGGRGSLTSPPVVAGDATLGVAARNPGNPHV